MESPPRVSLGLDAGTFVCPEHCTVIVGLMIGGFSVVLERNGSSGNPKLPTRPNSDGTNVTMMRKWLTRTATEPRPELSAIVALPEIS